MSTKRITAGVFSQPRPRGPNGERLCFNCRGPLPKGKRFNCSPKCSDEWRCKTSPQAMRYAVLERDHGICALCGIDCIALEKFVSEVNRLKKGLQLPQNFWHDFKTALRIGDRWPGDLWDADHIKPVVEGGGECGIENFRTLCIPCHKGETAELHHRLAHARHIKKLLPMFEEVECGPVESTVDGVLDF